MEETINESEQEVEKTNEVTETKNDAGNTGNGISLLNEAKAAATELKALIAENKRMLNKLNEQEATAILSGKSNAGQIAVKPAEETSKEYAARIMRGGK